MSAEQVHEKFDDDDDDQEDSLTVRRAKKHKDRAERTMLLIDNMDHDEQRKFVKCWQAVGGHNFSPNKQFGS